MRSETEDRTDRTGKLEAELAEVEKQLHEAEQQGAEIASLAEQEIGRLKDELVQVKKTSGKYCTECHLLLRILYVAVGMGFGMIWFFVWFPWSTAEAWQDEVGVGLVLAPVTFIELDWRWELFKRDTAWVAWNDNDVYRRIAARWNGLLERKMMR
jgi:hypothetical protein